MYSLFLNRHLTAKDEYFALVKKGLDKVNIGQLLKCPVNRLWDVDIVIRE